LRQPNRSPRAAGFLLVVLALLAPAFASRAASASALASPVWLAGTDGGVFALGGASFRGSLGGRHLNQPVIAVAGDRGGRGYWLAALDGGVFSFGDAHFSGSAGAMHLNQPIAGMVPTPSGGGYWLVAADGGVFSFGDAHFHGSLGGTSVTPAIAALAATPNGHGYWVLRRDGRVYHFGNAAALPDAAGASVLAVGLVPTQSGAGYWIAFADGTVRAFGDAAPLGPPPIRSAAPIVGLATPRASSSGFALPLLEFLRTVANAGASQRTWVGPREVALTFDDGPSSYTPSVLAVLARYNVPATFFTVGYLAAERPDLLIAEANAGMSV
jgi:peptidoglycan/xylan/chitin deacetylase (PgdA/CDA1 family)